VDILSNAARIYLSKHVKVTTAVTLNEPRCAYSDGRATVCELDGALQDVRPLRAGFKEAGRLLNYLCLERGVKQV